MATTIVPILGSVVVAAFTAAFGIYSYSRQKRVDRENYVEQKDTDRKVELRNLRMKAYERYLAAYREWSGLEEGSDEETKALHEYWDAYSSLFQTASDPVLLAATEFHALVWNWNNVSSVQRF